jgi:hypothetical protein
MNRWPEPIDVEEVVKPDPNFKPQRPDVRVLRRSMEQRKRLEDAGLLQPLPPDHWVWEALQEQPPPAPPSNA